MHDKIITVKLRNDEWFPFLSRCVDLFLDKDVKEKTVLKKIIAQLQEGNKPENG